MKTIPRHWGYAKTEDNILIWRSSPYSVQDAEAEARRVVQRILEYRLDKRPSKEEYPYGVTLREKLLEEINDFQGNLQGFITRNHAGAEVLNVRNIMFLDWDTPIAYPTLGGCLLGVFSWIGRLFGGKSELAPLGKPVDPLRRNPGTGAIGYEKLNPEWNTRTPEAWEDQYPWAIIPELAAFMQYVTKMPEWSTRIYKTAAGYRGIVTHAPFDPTAPETLRLMEQFVCDPQYIRLCKRQESFRARITPKGWRCGLWPNKLPQHFNFYWPFSSEFLYHLRKLVKYMLLSDHSVEEFLKRHEKFYETQKRFSRKDAEINYEEAFSLYQEHYDKAEEIYEEAATPFATCRYLGTVGSEFIHPEIKAILDIHDEATRALSSEELTLA